MMQELVSTLQLFIHSIAANLPVTLGMIVTLIIIHILNIISRYRLLVLGIVPRHMTGLIGILFAPLLHRDFTHLIFNSLPLFLLSNLVLMRGMWIFMNVTIFIVIVGGMLTWLLGRRALHVGSSSVIMGYFGFLFAQAYFSHSFFDYFTLAIAFYYFGGILLGLIPHKKGVSWEGHLFGFIAGITASLFLMR